VPLIGDGCAYRETAQKVCVLLCEQGNDRTTPLVQPAMEEVKAVELAGDICRTKKRGAQFVWLKGEGRI
jgi:hypothetical protein